MAPVVVDESGESPRSTILLEAAGSRMTTTVMNESNVRSNLVGDTTKTKEKDSDPPPQDRPENPASPVETKAAPSESSNSKNENTPETQKEGTDNSDRMTPNPQANAAGMSVNYQSHLTPQSMSGYYLGYPQQHQSQITPEPPSPGPGVATVSYDAASFFQQPAAFAHHSSAFGVAAAAANTPLSPPRATTMGVIPPASPLFPRVTSTGAATAAGLAGRSVLDAQRQVAPPSPNLPYMSPQLGTSVYQQYPMTSQSSIDSPEEGAAWDSSLPPSHQTLYQSSPQMGAMAMTYGMPITRTSSGGRAYSFDETMLPPSMLDPQDQANPAYSPYSQSQSSPIATGATLFAQPQPWAYAGGPPDMYSTPASPLQPRPTAHGPMGMYGGAVGAMRPVYGQYYPASSPGPPIQTTASNKGPDGANLFIFHIPNHFTNLDMYQLFCPYGNLLSVRIMVEKDTGRSRGFGFVSYDNPESAALAIKELNGFAIGNKRLKVQHKQIRSKDISDMQGGFGMPGEGGYHRSSMSSLPPSGASASQNNNMWYDRKTDSHDDEEGSPEAPKQPDEGTELTSTSTETPLHLGSSSNNNNNNEQQQSPLASLGTLQNALPDVPGNGGTKQ